MKRNFFLILALLSLSLCVEAQDWTGRIYDCSDTEMLREQISKQMKADPEFQEMGFMEKQMVSTIISCMKLKMTMKFKKDNKVVTTASVTLDSEKLRLVPGINELREVFDEAARDMAKSMNSTDTYKVNGNTVDIGDAKFAISDGEKRLSLSEDGITLSFVRKK